MEAGQQQEQEQEQQKLEVSDLVKGTSQLAIDACGLYYAFQAMIFKLNKTETLSDGIVPYPYANANGVGISSGRVVKQPVKDEATGKTNIVENRLYYQLDTKAFVLKNFIQAIAVGFDNHIDEMGKAGASQAILNRIHDKVGKGILQRALAKGKSIIADFKAALNEHLKKIEAVEQYKSSLLTGDDFIFAPTENLNSLGRRLKALRMKPPKNRKDGVYAYVVDSLYYDLEYASAIYSTTCSTFFIVVDSIGQSIGAELAELNVGICKALARMRIPMKSINHSDSNRSMIPVQTDQ
ncbi:hypothetical protein GAMM_60004 [Gammaproteobacteria bacterium]